MRDRSNHVLDPQSGTNIEVGLKGEYWGRKLNSGLALFQTQEDNVPVLDAGALLSDGTMLYHAVRGARTKALG